MTLFFDLLSLASYLLRAGLTFGYNLGAAANVQNATAETLAPGSFDSLKQGVLSGSIILGAMFGSLIAGSLAERFGRKKGMLVLSLITTVACAVSAVMPNFWALSTLRLFLGIGVGTYLLATSVLH
jgi:MFS transporter, SP family, major inositol transporter